MKTKQITLTLSTFSVLLFFIPFGYAQEKGFRYGGRIGLGEGIIHLNGETTESSKLALSIGGTSVYQFNRFLGLSADFILTSKGGKSMGITQGFDFFGASREYKYQENFNIFSGEIPLMFKFNIPLGEDISIRSYIGPSMQFQFLGLQSRTYEDPNFNSENGYIDQKISSLETVEYGMIYGAGLEVKALDSRVFFLDFRMNKSISTLGMINDEKAKSSYYMVSVGYLF